MDILNNIIAYSNTHRLIQSGSKIVIGLSGGPDSVFLFHYFMHIRDAYNLNIIAAHLNHEWRQEADSEEQFCLELAQKHKVEFVARKISQLEATVKYDGSKEGYARAMRRYFLETIARDARATHIALAHHEQDQQETFFIRLLRGATLTGLTCMRPQAGLYIRPLLATSKKDILAYLHEHNLSYVIDQSNESPSFLRNRIRSLALPALKECDQRFDTTFSHTLARLQETEELLEHVTQETYTHISVLLNQEKWIDLTRLKKIHPALQCRIIMCWLCKEGAPFDPSHTFLQEIIRFLYGPKGGTHSMHSQWSIIKKKKYARIVIKR